MQLKEVIHSNKKLLLVFEYVEWDLKKFMSQINRDKGMEPMLIKVANFIIIVELLLSIAARN